MNFLVIRTCTHCVLSINGVLTNYLQLLKMSYAYNLVNSIFKDHRNGRNSQKNNDIRISWQYAHLVIIPTKFHKLTKIQDWRTDFLTDWLIDWLTNGSKNITPLASSLRELYVWKAKEDYCDLDMRIWDFEDAYTVNLE